MCDESGHEKTYVSSSQVNNFLILATVLYGKLDFNNSHAAVSYVEFKYNCIISATLYIAVKWHLILTLRIYIFLCRQMNI